MTAEPTTVETRYTNRPPRPGGEESAGAGHHPGRTRGAEVRAVDRILLCLRAYEQRAARRAALHEWIATRAALTAAAAAAAAAATA